MVVQALDLPAYAALPKHVPGWIAAHLGIPNMNYTSCPQMGGASPTAAVITGLVPE